MLEALERGWGWGESGRRTSSSSRVRPDAPREGPGKPPTGVIMLWLRISAQTWEGLGEVIRVQAEMAGFGHFLGQAVETLWGPGNLCRHMAGRGEAETQPPARVLSTLGFASVCISGWMFSWSIAGYSSRVFAAGRLRHRRVALPNLSTGGSTERDF